MHTYIHTYTHPHIHTYIHTYFVALRSSGVRGGWYGCDGSSGKEGQVGKFKHAGAGRKTSRREGTDRGVREA
eukprot:16434084-Heterocapsa_arctica.AAC.1